MRRFETGFEAGVSQGKSISIRGAVRGPALAVAVAMLAVLGAPQSVSAQGWWPFGGNEEEPRERPPIPSEPVYRPPPQEGPPADQAPEPIGPPVRPGMQQSDQPGPPPAQQPPPASASNWSTKNPICLQLEQRLVQEGQKGNARDELPRIEDEIRVVDRDFNTGESQLDRSCYEYFLFAKTFRNTPQCKDLARQVDVAKRKLADLEARRQDIVGSSGRSYQDDIIRELARNNCGANYVDMARRRTDGMWQDDEVQGGGNVWSPRAANGAQTYRTLCVRLCDGFYFPVSFSTLPSHFTQDADVCTSKCAAPTELYYYPNPGGSVDQSVALKTQEAYTKLKFAFRYRKEYVNGCSCKVAEYVPPEGTPEKKAENGASKGITTGSTAVPPSSDPAAPAAGAGWQTQETPTQPQ